MITDNKLHVVLTIGEDGQLGSGELIRGWNKRYKLAFYGHGTGGIRNRIVETNRGEYLMLAGGNKGNIGRIKAYIGDEEYGIDVSEQEFYIKMIPIEETHYVFASAMIVYDVAGKELMRINLPKDEGE